MGDLPTCPMEYYVDTAEGQNYMEIADNLLQNRIYLWGSSVYCEPTAENIFDTVFTTSVIMNREWLLAMDYLSSLLSAYQQTNNPEYEKKFLEIVIQFFEYYDRGSLSLSASDDVVPWAQTLMFIKSFSVIQYEEVLKVKIKELLYTYAEYCYDDRNHWNNDNHGLFSDMALLHLSVLFGRLSEADKWRAHAIERVRQLFEATFFEDGFNNEGSLVYFRFNVIQYWRILKFCDAYQITGLELLKHRLEWSDRVVMRSFAHSDNSYPIIGDGRNFSSFGGHNNLSAFYPCAGICVVKTENMYLTFKYKSIMQAHTHVDDLTVTARFGILDLALDPGQYNYDRYHPVNRFLRTSSGHSGIFPLCIDGLSLKEYLDRRKSSKISQFAFDGTTWHIGGSYELNGGAIKVWRNIAVQPERIEVRDSWFCAAPQNMRQRFVLPKEFLNISRFTASSKTFETLVESVRIKYAITSKDNSAITTMNFGVAAPKHMKYEPTVLLDTIVENSQCGEIITTITVSMEEE